MVCCFGSVSSDPPLPATSFNLDLNRSLGCSKTAERHAATHAHSHYLDYAFSPSLSSSLFSAPSLHADCPSLSYIISCYLVSLLSLIVPHSSRLPMCVDGSRGRQREGETGDTREEQER